MGQSEFIHDPDKMAAAVLTHQIQWGQVDLHIPNLLHQIRMLLQEPADPVKLQITDAVNQAVVLRNPDKDIRRNPAKLRML